MFNLEEVKGYSKLDAKDKELFGRFYQKFYKAWEYPEDHKPISISRAKGYLKVTLNDGDWLHILKDGSWY
ncbi:hypothetical protein D9O40_00880 [Clostridium autoethanogenum]|uniref:Uncharacterized protein n=1 Tax=Clostridium autoethanogenum TaxID=84023 RepID=A0A3M0T3X0_9CLOT|nr:hypothetical protein [Clostridium autoethanogenum]RMD04935.1 hypothetical protein D9O40_00880 [Clostridium autoethanogenum]